MISERKSEVNVKVVSRHMFLGEISSKVCWTMSSKGLVVTPHLKWVWSHFTKSHTMVNLQKPQQSEGYNQKGFGTLVAYIIICSGSNSSFSPKSTWKTSLQQQNLPCWPSDVPTYSINVQVGQDKRLTKSRRRNMVILVSKTACW